MLPRLQLQWQQEIMVALEILEPQRRYRARRNQQKPHLVRTIAHLRELLGIMHGICRCLNDGAFTDAEECPYLLP